MKTPVMIEEYLFLVGQLWIFSRALLNGQGWKALYWGGAFILTVAVVWGMRK